MPEQYAYDAIIIGSGPNGLAAAITIARTGRSVLVLEAKDTVGGGMRSAELTLPGYTHDICSAIHPLGVGSPFFQQLPLTEHGLAWIFPDASLAHPLDDGTAVVLEHSLAQTCAWLGQDARAYLGLMNPLVEGWDDLAADLLGPPPLLPRAPILLARFGMRAVWPAQALAQTVFRGERAKALFAGLAAHSIMALDRPLTAAFGLMLGILGHAIGWPLPRGGSQQITAALASYLRSLGGQIETNTPVKSVDDLPPAKAVLFDITPQQFLNLAGHRLPSGYRSKLAGYRYGAGVFKVDWALDGPIPWRAKECLRAGTVHIGGTLAEIAASERSFGQGRHPKKPYLIVAQQSLFDPTRAPAGKHTGWAYCHVPNGSTVDMTEKIEAQIERFAPGFRDLILARSTMSTRDFERYNPNYIGGDINGGVQDWRQLFTRPTLRLTPYSTPNKRFFLCSSSTPPGGGVHGMCGYHAARAALRTVL